MSMTYLDTLGVIVAAGTDGVAYATMTRAMKVHTRSLHTEGVVASYSGDEAASLDTEGAVICLTESGYATVELYAEAGLLQPFEVLLEQGSAKPKPKPKPKRRTTARRRKTTRVTTRKTVPTPTESVEPEPTNPIKPEGAIRRVPGGQIDHWQKAPVQDDRLESLERKVSALMAALSA
jgi:hypothetical protein